MNEANPFVISQFTNPSGEVVFRVDGRLDGATRNSAIVTIGTAEGLNAPTPAKIGKFNSRLPS